MRTTLGARSVVRYAEQFAWSIARGHYALKNRSAVHGHCGSWGPLDSPTCSCGSRQCAVPGCHPVSENWAAEASSDVEAITRLWRGEPWWPIAVTGIEFDAVVVKGPLPCSALARAGHNGKPLGLVLTWRDEWHAFFTAPGALGRSAARWHAGLNVRSAGSWIPLPAVALHSPARWVESPMEPHGLVLNSAEAVLATLSARGRRDEPMPRHI